MPMIVVGLTLGAIGTYISSVKPDFDTRNYGYDKLSGLIKALGLFETKSYRAVKCT